MTKLIFINDIDIKASPLTRAELNKEVADEYGQAIKAKVPLPPPVVFQREKEKFFLLGDGLHRVSGARAYGVKALVCEVREGGYEEALAHALTANTAHGLRRTQADKRRCVEAALVQWPKLSDTELGKRCNVDHKTVGVIRKGNNSPAEARSPKRQDKNGVTRSSTREVKRGIPYQEPSEEERKLIISGEMKDATGFLIPKELAHLWLRIPECQNLIDNMVLVRKEIERAEKDKDPMFLEVNTEGVVAVLNEVVTKLSVLIPYAVCTNCQGQELTKKKCGLCHGRGLISKFRWDLVPDEVKKVRAKEAK